MTDTVRELLAGTEAQIAEILAATTEQHTTDGIRRPQPGSRPPCDLDRIDRLIAELDQVRYWSNRWGSPTGNIGQRITYLINNHPYQPPEEAARLLRHWGPIRKANQARWPTEIEKPEVWWTYAEAMNHTGRSERALRNWMRSNPSISTVRNGTIMFNEERLTALLRSKRSAPSFVPVE